MHPYVYYNLIYHSQDVEATQVPISRWIKKMWYIHKPRNIVGARMLSCFSSMWLSATPWSVAHQAPLYMGFSRQEYWSGLPCPFPENLKEMATQSSILAWRIPWTEEPGGLQSTGSQRIGHDWATSLTSLTHSFPHSGIELASPTSPALQADSVPTEPPGKPMMEYYSPIKNQWIVTIWDNMEGPRGLPW